VAAGLFRRTQLVASSSHIGVAHKIFDLSGSEVKYSSEWISALASSNSGKLYRAETGQNGLNIFDEAGSKVSSLFYAGGEIYKVYVDSYLNVLAQMKDYTVYGLPTGRQIGFVWRNSIADFKQVEWLDLNPMEET
jgi:ER membrane protein complex subunit 1